MTENNYSIRFQHSTDLITDKTGLLLIDEFWKRFHLSKIIYNDFGKPGSNRGIKASTYVRTLVELIIDGGTHLEDVRKLEADSGYKKLTGIKSYLSSDATGDWLRRQGELGGEKKMWKIITHLLKMNLVSKVVCAKELFECFIGAYNKLKYVPLAPSKMEW
jgi:hypothetical protein